MKSKNKFRLRFTSLFIFILTLISVLFNFSCTNNGNVINLNYFNTNIHIESYDSKIDESTKNKIENVLTEIEQKVSNTKSDSTVSVFNKSDKNTAITLDSVTSQVYKKAMDIYSLTQGKFNVAVYPLTRLWQLSSDTFNNGLREFTLPTVSQISDTKQLCDISLITYNEKENTLSKSDDGVAIDLGGITKGYAVEMIKNVLDGINVSDGYINVGSSSLYLYDVNSLSIRHPRRNNELSTIVTLNHKIKNTAVSTSGDYERYFEKDGKRYCHVIDPFTGIPTATGITSVTLLGNDGIILDALSTALMLYGYSPLEHDNSDLIIALKEYLSAYPLMQVFITYDNGEDKILLTNVDKNDFILNDDSYTLKEI